MSHTNSTAHYELPQFLGTDKPAWLTDVNGAMSAIDTGIYSAQTKANEADAKATQNTSDITTQGGQITTLSGKVTALETAQPVDEAQIELNRQNIATNAQNIVQLDNTIGHTSIAGIGDGKVTGAIADLDTRVDALEDDQFPVKVIATSSSNATYASQLAELKSAYSNLTTDEKRRSAIMTGAGVIYRCFSTDGGLFSFSYTSSLGTPKLEVASLDVINSKFHLGQVQTGGFTSTDTSSNVNPSNLLLVIL